MTTQAETTEGTTSSTALEPVAPGVIARVKSEKPWNMLDLADMLAGPAAEFTKADTLPSPAPKVEFSDLLRKALKALPDLFGQVMPEKVRTLDRHELKALTDEVNAINTIADEMKARREAISAIIRNHQDKAAEEDGLVGPDTHRVADGVAKGHWLLATEGNAHKTPVDGYADAWEQRKIKGKVAVDPSVLGVMAKSGDITHEEFLAVTSAPRGRVYDQDKMSAFIRRNPARALSILARMTSRSAPSASLVSPKK